jgi:hypothetical protein
MAQIAMHIAHNGFPPPLRAFAKRPELSSMAEVLFAMLRQEPGERPTAAAVRKELARLAPSLAKWAWPLDRR